MAWRIVKQPNGLLAIFSDIVDNFTVYHMTPEEAFKECFEQTGRQEAMDKVQRGIDDIEPWSHSKKGDGLSRWRDCLELIEMQHGVKARKEIEEKLSQTAEEI